LVGADRPRLQLLLLLLLLLLLFVVLHESRHLAVTWMLQRRTQRLLF